MPTDPPKLTEAQRAFAAEHVGWAMGVGRCIADEFPRLRDREELAQEAALAMAAKVPQFDPGRVPPGGDVGGAFRGWAHPTVQGVCRRKALSILGGGLFGDSVRDYSKVPKMSEGVADGAHGAEGRRRDIAVLPPADGHAIQLLRNSPDVTFLIDPGDNGLTVVGDPDINEWTESFERLRERSESFLWALGDLVVYGLDRFGPAAQRVIDDSGYADESVKVAAWVCRKFPKVNRLTGLSFKHHLKVAGLPPAKAAAMLALAAAGELSSNALGLVVKRDAGEPTAPDEYAAFARPAGALSRALDALTAEARSDVARRAAVPAGEWAAFEGVLGKVAALRGGAA